MKTIALTMLIGLFSFTGGEKIATYKTDNAKSSMKILGTSTVHDWEMTANNMKGAMNVDIYKESINIKNLKLVVEVESLKSGKSGMDNNAYKALQAKSHPQVQYELVEVKSQTAKGGGSYELVTLGKLSIAGKTHTMSIPLTAQVQNGTLNLKGSTSFKMSQFGVEAPSFMFGSVTTADEITINFNINYKS